MKNDNGCDGSWIGMAAKLVRGAPGGVRTLVLAGILVFIFIFGFSRPGWPHHLLDEYRISLTESGMVRFAKAAGLRIESLGGHGRYIVTSYCAQVLGLVVINYHNPYKLNVVGVARTNKGGLTWISLCSANVVPTRAYGYLCEQLDMEFGRIEAGQIVCERGIRSFIFFGVVSRVSEN